MLCVFISVNYDKKEEQMAKASINIQVASGNSEKHMDRVSKTTYLLDPDSKNNEYKTYRSSKDYLSAAKVAAKKKTGRSMQKLAEKNFVQEAVLNLNKDHTIEDVEKVFKELQKEFGGFEVFKISVHRDEGYFYHKKEELEYRPNRDIFFNEKDKTFYLDKNYSKKADLNQFEKRYNYHAHVLFTKFDMSKGKNARLNKSDMRKLQTITAKSLGMERGEEFSKAKRKSHWQLKESYDIKRDTKKEVLAKKKDIDLLKKEIRAEMISEGGHSKEEYQSLNKLFKDLKEKHKEQKLTIEDLKEKVNHWKHEAMNWRESKTYKDLYEDAKKENEYLKKELQAKISVNAPSSTTVPNKNDLKPILDILEDNFKREDLVKINGPAQDLTASKGSDYLLKELFDTKGTIEVEKRGKFGSRKEVKIVKFDFNDFNSTFERIQDREEKVSKVSEMVADLFKRIHYPIEKVKDAIKNFISPLDRKPTQKKTINKSKGMGL